MRLATGALACSALAFGCAYSRVDDGALDGDAFEAIVQRVEIARGIRAERPIDARVVGQDQIGRVVEAAVRASRSPEEIAGYQAGLVTVGLWPPDRDLVDEFVSVMGEEMLGVYLPAERALYVVSDPPVPISAWAAEVLARRDPIAEMTLSHELVHLLQHQRYPALLDDDDFYLENDDAAIAAQCAFEGDAMLFGMLAMGHTPTPEVVAEEFERGVEQSGEALRRAPSLIRELIGFPYVEGYRLAAREGVGLLEDPPASSEQAMHPERRWEPFSVFDLAPLADALPDGCEAVSENTVGELQLSVLLGDREGGGDPAAWSGWDGDRYLAVRCDGAPALVWLTSWDSEADAEEFALAYLDAAPEIVARAGFAAPLRVHRAGRDVVVSSAALAALEPRLEALVLRKRVRSLAELRDRAGAR